ncbi:MAG: hypothetical protein AMS24_03235 [Chlamydiae bacterium SM23_39]|nr:MAG: hypothetical protein AMS24_03235 [Chlamydiae bacterium SM23_39]
MINEKKLHFLLEKTKEDSQSEKKVISILEKAKNNAVNLKNSSEYVQSLEAEETAILLNVNSSNESLMQKLFDTALFIKRSIYGNRIVIFAPLYVSNFCQGSCLYCGFRATNKLMKRKALTKKELIAEVKTLQQQGHKRLLMLMGDHPKYSFEDFIKAVEIASRVTSKPHGEIRRINVEIPSLTIEQFKKLKATGKIGTYTLFQETYHKKTYQKVHPAGPKADYDWRLNTMDRALEANMDDVGIGVLFGLYDYRFEVLALLAHAKHLDEKFNIGPHTISIPRMQSALNTPLANNPPYSVNDRDFKKLVAIIRCAVPYTGMILTTRESPNMRKELYHLGISQISAGSRTNPGGYSKSSLKKDGQFSLSDMRPTKEVIRELVQLGFIPSWCTACYRLGRTGEAFMEFAKKGNIQNYCHPNALLTFAEYLIDYTDIDMQKLGWETIQKELVRMPNSKRKEALSKNLEKIKNGQRDLFF